MDPFQRYKSTSNLHHLPATSITMIGHTDQANHQYDMNDFWDAPNAGNMPAELIEEPQRRETIIENIERQKEQLLVNILGPR